MSENSKPTEEMQNAYDKYYKEFESGSLYNLKQLNKDKKNMTMESKTIQEIIDLKNDALDLMENLLPPIDHGENYEAEALQNSIIELADIASSLTSKLSDAEKENYQNKQRVEIHKRQIAEILQQIDLLESKLSDMEKANEWRDAIKNPPKESGEYLGLVKSYDSYTNYIVFWRAGRRTYEVYGLGRREPVTDMNVIKWKPLPDLSEFYPSPPNTKTT